MGLQIKPNHAPHRLENGAVWLGPQMPGEATEITDEAGVVWPICRRLDGTRSREVLVAEVLAEQRPDGEATAGDIGEIIDFFIASGWVLDTAAPIPPELSEHELERYQRNAQFFSAIDLRPGSTGYGLQARLKVARVAVLGLGGVGSAAATSLTGCGVGSLHCVDYDTVELSNLNRQLLYTERDIGRSKVDAGVEHLRSRQHSTGIRFDPEHVMPRDPAENPVIAPTAQIAGHFLAMETILLLLGMKVPTAGRELHRYVVDYDEQYYLDAEPQPDCPVGCGALMPR